MIKARFGDRLDRWLLRILPFLRRRRLSPTALTLAGVAFSLASALAFAQGAFVTGGLLLAVGGLFDLVDGLVARHHGTTSTFGAFLDSTMDRLSDMAVPVGLMIHYGRVDSPGSALLAGIVLMAGVMTSYAKARAERYLPSFEGGLVERGERIGLLILGGLTGWMLPVLWILAIGGTATTAQRFVVAHRELKRIDQTTRSGVEEPS